MFTISTTHKPATDLGFLLHKNPSRVHEFELTFGNATLIYTEASEDRCTAAILLQIDPVNLVRGKGHEGGSLTQYVNDRPYVASSFVSVAMTSMFGTAMSGRCKDKPELAEKAIPLEVHIPVLPCRGGEAVVRKLFEPLGYEVSANPIELDPKFPEWGKSFYWSITLKCTLRMQDVLRHLYLLLPVMDARKHYFMESNEVDKLLRKGEGWLVNHPEKKWIVRSYLGRKPSLMREALEQLANLEPEVEMEEAAVDQEMVAPDEPIQAESQESKKRKSLHEQRHDRIVEIVRELRPSSLVDLGCGEGRLIRKLVPIPGLGRIVGMDVSYFELEKAERKLRLETSGPKMRERVQLLHGSLMYRDDRLQGFDVATVVEVIEHLDPPRLSAFERVVFECAQPKTVIVTTPNQEYNAVFERLEGFRHDDHRFEWTRQEFADWANGIAEKYSYQVRLEGLGEEHAEYGHASQMGVFSR